MGLVVHAGGRVVTRDDLALVEVPPATDSYSPVPHERLTDTLSTIGRDILKGFALEREQYALAREGKQMFGVLAFRSDSTEIGLSIGFRNSYDKSMAIGIAIGASVFVCDNLALTGDITLLKKHTANVWASLEDTAIATLYRSQKNFESIAADAESLKAREIEDNEAFRLMGLLFGKGVLSPGNCNDTAATMPPHMPTQCVPPSRPTRKTEKRLCSSMGSILFQFQIKTITALASSSAPCRTIVLIVAIFVFALVPQPTLWIRIVSRIALLPVIAVISYEIMKFGAGDSKNRVVQVLLAPGLLLQTLTTREPDDSQIEAAISALNEVIQIDKTAESSAAT